MRRLWVGALPGLVAGLLGALLGVGAAGQTAGSDSRAAPPVNAKTAALEKADAVFKAGYAAMEAGKLEVARADFAETVRLAPMVPEARVALGAVLVQLGRPEEAVPVLEKALAMKPGDEGTETNLSVAHEAAARKMLVAGKAAEAEREIRAAIGVMGVTVEPTSQNQDVGHPQSSSSIENVGKPDLPADAQGRVGLLEDELGSLLARERRWAEAEGAFREAIRLMPEGALGSGTEPGEVGQNGSAGRAGEISHIHLGVVLVEEKEFPEGLHELATAVEGDPKNAFAQFELGRGLALAGRDEEAVPHFEAALRANPQLAGGALEMAMAEQRLGRQEESVPWFEKAIAQEPKNGVALTNMGLALTQMGKSKEAGEFLRRALAVTPEDPVLLEDLGVSELQQSHFEEAIGWFGKALAVDAANPQVHYDLGLAYKLKDRMEDAVGELKKAIALDPNLPDPPYTLGILYMQTGKLEDAAVELRAALALRPQNGDGWAVLGSVLKQMDKPAEAEEALRKAVELLPEQPGAHITLAGVLAEEGKTADAAAERKIAAGLSRGAVSRQKAMFSTNAGNQLLLRGEVGDAVGRYLDAIAADPGYAEAHAQLAVAYERQGRMDEAKVERDKAAGLGK